MGTESIQACPKPCRDCPKAAYDPGDPLNGSITRPLLGRWRSVLSTAPEIASGESSEAFEVSPACAGSLMDCKIGLVDSDARALL